MNKHILFIAYYFDEKFGVASSRSRTLNRFLNEMGISTRVMHKSSFGIFAENFFPFWIIRLFFVILFSQEKKVYISCGPFQHLFATSLAVFIRKKHLIIDFRDPWSLNIKTGYGHKVKPSKVKLKIAEAIEKISYEICTHFVVCTRGMYNEYQELFRDKDKIKLIMNGYDFEPEIGKKTVSTDTLHVVCLGKFAEYSLDRAIDSLQRLKDTAKQIPNLHIHFIGSDKEKNQMALERAKLLENVTFYPRMHYNDALDIAKKCNVGLLVLRNENIEYGTKVFDYIGLNLQIVDTFEEESIFREEFHPYIFSGKIADIPYEERLKFHRWNIYYQNAHIFKDP